MSETLHNKNIILETDSYKFTHWKQYHPDTEAVYSYQEARPGAKYPYTVFFGLQRILKDWFIGRVVDSAKIAEARWLSNIHFGNEDIYNLEGWQYISTKLNGKLPLRIKAVPEGIVVPIGNVLMTIENTDTHCAWLTNYVESLLMHDWYPITVATVSKYTIDAIIKPYWEASADNLDGLVFALHDFGYRGGTSEQSATIGSMAHLINSHGTDTVSALKAAHDYYGASYATLGFSIPATEHSVMSSEGPLREFQITERVLNAYNGPVSIVGDTNDIYKFVDTISNTYFKDIVLHRQDGVFVVRPDSTTERHRTPEDLVEWILDTLWNRYGGHLNHKGFRVLDSHIRVIWGDGLTPTAIDKILKRVINCNFSAENITLGMGGGLIQKDIDRDTQRFAIKASAIKRNGEWHDIHKNTPGKSSKSGRLSLIQNDFGEYKTVHEIDEPFRLDEDLLKTVFENGELVREYTFDEVRANSLL